MAPPKRWNDLVGRLDGKVLLPGTDEFDSARRTFIARFDRIVPEAVVRPRGTGDVAATVDFARAMDIPFAIRSGGHSFAGYSSSEGIVLDLQELDDITINEAGVHVGAGARIGELYKALARDGLTVPAGGCPTVGIAGTTLGGGHGILGRKYGLTCDHLVGAVVVLGDGSVVHVDEAHEPDLFWALRGAGGGNFGVVTELVFRPRPALPMTSFYLVWPYDDAIALTTVWLDRAPVAPREIAAALAYNSTERLDDPPFLELFGAALSDEEETGRWLDDFVAAVGRPPSSDNRSTLSFEETVLYQAGLLVLTETKLIEVEAGQLMRHAIRFTKSEFFRRTLPSEGVEALVEAFARDRVAGEYRGIEIGPWGGEIAAIPSDATAWAHRDELVSIKETVLVDPSALEPDQAAAREWVAGCWESTHPWGTGHVYPNFPDPDLDDWPEAYYGANYRRLQQVKAAYDPENVFRFGQSIRLPA